MSLRENGYSGVEYDVHIKCMKESTKKAICAKKFKGLNIFLSAL